MRRCSFIAMCGTILVCASASLPHTALSETAELTLVTWRAGNSSLFQEGTREENGARTAQGALPVRVYRPDGVVLSASAC
jgi:hypothetical protein